VAAFSRYFPEAQVVQVVLAVVELSLYLPAMQIAQLTLSMVYRPTPQKVHDAADPDPATLTFPSSQFVQDV